MLVEKNMKSRVIIIAAVLAIFYLIGSYNSAALKAEREKDKERARRDYSHSSYSYGSSTGSGSSSVGTARTGSSNNSKFCIYPGCHKQKSVEGGEYCFQHKCHVEGCTNKRVDGDWSCAEHGGVVGRFDK